MKAAILSMKDEEMTQKNESISTKRVCPIFLDVWVNNRVSTEDRAIHYKPRALNQKHSYQRNRDSEGPRFPRIETFDSAEPTGKHPCKCGAPDAWKCWSKVRREVLFGNERLKGINAYPTKFEGAIRSAAMGALGDHFREWEYEDIVQHLRTISIAREKVSYGFLLQKAQDFQKLQIEPVTYSRDAAREKQAEESTAPERLSLKGEGEPAARWAKGSLYFIISCKDMRASFTKEGSLTVTTSTLPATIELNPGIRGKLDWGEKGGPCFRRHSRTSKRLSALWEPKFKGEGLTSYRASDSIQGDYGADDLGYSTVDYAVLGGQTERQGGHE